MKPVAFAEENYDFQKAVRQFIRQEIRSLLKIGDSFKKIVITSHAPAPLYDSHGILTMSIYDFLLNSDSLDM